MNRRLRLSSVRARFLLVVLLGVLVPLALVGSWLASTGQRSAELLLREQLEKALVDATTSVGYRWIETRSRLLNLGEHPAVLDALRAGTEPLGASAPPEVQRAWASLSETVSAIEFTGADGVRVARYDLESMAAGDSWTGTTPVRVPLFDRLGARIGSMDVHLRLWALLPAAYLSAGTDRIAAVLTEAGVPLGPLAMNPELLMRPGFLWAGEGWLAAHRRIAEPALVLTLAAPVGPATLPFTIAARRGLWALLVVSVVGFLLALLLTRRITVPLERLADAADSVAQGDLEHQVNQEGPDETRRLGAAFNIMMRSLQGTLRRLSQQEAAAAVGGFAASLAHEVRNPLTAVRLDLERAREKVADTDGVAPLLDRALQQIERLDATVSGSLRIARSGNVPLERVDIREPIRGAITAATPDFVARAARLEVSVPTEELLVHGNSAALEQLFLNLLLNAATALTAQGGAVLDARSLGDTVQVTVRDTGCGIPPAALDRIWEPFFTTREEGTGLGLTIVRRIAEVHGAELHMESQLGVGTTVRLRLQSAVTIPRGSGTFRYAPDPSEIR
jgi:signal transduction histidine kinase